MSVLSDGTVVPSFLSTRAGAGHSGFARSMMEMGLREGLVVAVHAPSADTNTNKHYYEYDVKVDHVDNGTHTEIIFPRARLGNSFGGVADFVRWRPRLGGRASNDDGAIFSTGSRVYVMCVNGNTKSAIILGGAQHPVGSDPEGDEEPLFVFEFNGIRAEIHPNGDFKLIHRGATDPMGVVEEDDATKNGTSITMDAEGDILIGTGADSQNLIHLDSQGKRIHITGEEEVEIEAGGNVKINSTGVLTGGATDYTIMGTTYRTAQQALHQTVMPLLVSLSGLLATAGAQVAAAGGSMATAAGFHSIPVAGPILGVAPLTTASGALSGAGATLAAAAPLVTSIMAAIQGFEAAGPYLSTKNRSD